MLRLEDRWVWDFWLAQTRGAFHVFYLQAPKTLGHEALRHKNASIGHAVSEDLISWTVLRDAIGPGPPEEWDDLATWTGSVVEHDGSWYMLYTGVSSADGGLVQNFGLATPPDLFICTKHYAYPFTLADTR